MRTFTEQLHPPSTLSFLVITGELLSGIGLIVGLFSRIAALVINPAQGLRYAGIGAHWSASRLSRQYQVV
jgi:uncharacterized membrane protein YphA (DoxX/SURF4 family)